MASTAATLGAYRNLTDKFLRYRSQARSGSDITIDFSGRDAATRLLSAAIDNSSGSGEPAGVAGLSSSLPPGWVDHSDEASADIARIKEKMAELGKAHAKALLPNFDDMSGEEQVVEVITQETTRLFKRCEKRLQALSQGTEDAKVRQNVQRKLAMQLQKLSVEFRKMQKDYLQKLKQQQDRGPGAAGMDSLGFSTGIGADDEEDYDPGFSDLQLQRVNDAEREVMERDEEVMKILQSVNDLAAVMKDLSVLIIDQGTVLDRIDYNCEQVAQSVEQGKKELEKAETIQKNSRMIICIYFLIVACVVMTIVVVVQKL